MSTTDFYWNDLCNDLFYIYIYIYIDTFLALGPGSSSGWSGTLRKWNKNAFFFVPPSSRFGPLAVDRTGPAPRNGHQRAEKSSDDRRIILLLLNVSPRLLCFHISYLFLIFIFSASEIIGRRIILWLLFFFFGREKIQQIRCEFYLRVWNKKKSSATAVAVSFIVRNEKSNPKISWPGKEIDRPKSDLIRPMKYPHTSRFNAITKTNQNS